MSLDKKYRGYKSFDYLEKDIDYTVFQLTKEIDRVEPYVIPLSESEEERVKNILNEHPMISLHDHPIVLPEDLSQLIDYSREGRAVTGFEGLSKSCWDCIFDNMLDAFAFITSKSGWKWTDVIHDIGIRLSDLAHQDFVIVARTVDDIMRAFKEGKLALVPSLECSTPIENELDRIDVLYGLGVRQMGIAYSESNALGSGLKEKRDAGLTDFGCQCVERMNKLGMAIDTSHSSDQTTIDVAEVSSKPVFATHSGARALLDSIRMKRDDAIKAIADKGGVMALDGAPHTTATKQHPVQDIETFFAHFEYIKDLVGIDHISFGTDLMYGDHFGLQKRLIPEALSAAGSSHDPEYIKGLENPTEASWNIVRWLVKHGYSDEDIAKVIGGNTIRVLKEIWY